FKHAYEFNPENSLLNHHLGKALIADNQLDTALFHLLKAYKLAGEEEQARFAYELGVVMHRKHKFDQAILYYKQYLNSMEQESITQQREFLMKKIAECNMGKERIRDSNYVFIDRLSSVVNSPYPDYSPFVNADGSVLYFTSRRPETTGGKYDEYSNGYYEDIYFSSMENGQWQPPENPGKPLNTKYHDAVVGLSPDGQKLYLYRSERGGSIFQSSLDGYEWTEPEALPEPLNSKAHEPTATFTYDGRGIYFVSDREGGYGGSDIYYSERKENETWSEPENLGAAINTRYDEDGVFMHPDGKTLYFSSKGHNTMGGYDIFKTVNREDGWEEPQNLGYPVNTADDDIFFSVTASGRYGYYSSSRAGQQDIYRVHFLENEKQVANSVQDVLIAMQGSEVISPIEDVIEANSPDLTVMKGVVLDEENRDPVKAEIILVDNSTEKELARFKSNSKTGRYLVSLPAGKNYGIAVNAEGYLFHSENFNIPEEDMYKEVNKIIVLKKIKTGKSIVLNNVFFDFDVAEKVKRESRIELKRVVRLMQMYPDLKIEISGHTDNIGEEAYNKELSVERAKTVVKYLVKEGIERQRLSYKGYGSAKPVADNTKAQGREKNRRTEFKIISN
ncbi:MAG: OmpA family protein, partial [Bacteroidales bacterium]